MDAASYVLVDDRFEESDVDQLAELRATAGVPLEVGLAIFVGLSVDAAFATAGRTCPR